MSNLRKKAKVGFFIFIFLAIVGYTVFQSKNLIIGPQITIQEPLDGATLTNDLVNIRGQAKNITSITLDDRAIFVDLSGQFSEKLVAPVGYSVIKLDAKDRFGKEVKRFIHIYLPQSTLIPLGNSQENNASSSPNSTTTHDKNSV